MKKMKKILKSKNFQLAIVLIAGIFIGSLFFYQKRGEEHKHSESHEQLTEYTCSMHPQIRQNEPGNCPICGMELISVSAREKETEHHHSTAFIYSMSEEAVALANIQTYKIQVHNPEHEIFLNGKIAVNEQTISNITANFSGRIEKLFIDFTGQPVNAGQKLATVYSPELITAQKELLEASKYKKINPTLYNAAKEKLRLWKITENQIADIENKGEIITMFDVYSDKSGVVITRNVSKGDYVSRGSVIFEIADLTKVWILLDAYESDLPYLRTGQEIKFTLTSVPGREFISQISFIDPFINPLTRTVSVRAESNNPGLALKPEMFVNAKVKAELKNETMSILIPKTSLLWTGKRSVVYVKVPEMDKPSFEMREIILGASAGNYYVVTDGLKEGEEIVINGVFALDAAAQLSGNYSMMSRPLLEHIPVPAEFKQQFTEFVDAYFKMKNDLVASDFIKAHKSASNFQEKFNMINVEHLGTNAKEYWRKSETAIRKSIEKFSVANDIVEQRTAFAELSLQMIESVEAIGTYHDIVFVSFCPMAFDNKGGFWLSEFEQIKNPYYGDEMLKCGEVKKTLYFTQKHDTNDNREQDEHHHHHH